MSAIDTESELKKLKTESSLLEKKIKIASLKAEKAMLKDKLLMKNEK